MEIKFGENILTTSLNSKNGTITFSTGDFLTGTTYCPEVLLYQSPGLCSLPSNATTQGAAEAIIVDRPTAPVCIGIRDLRTQNKFGNIGSGETVIYSAG